MTTARTVEKVKSMKNSRSLKDGCTALVYSTKYLARFFNSKETKNESIGLKHSQERRKKLGETSFRRNVVGTRLWLPSFTRGEKHHAKRKKGARQDTSVDRQG